MFVCVDPLFIRGNEILLLELIPKLIWGAIFSLENGKWGKVGGELRISKLIMKFLKTN